MKKKETLSERETTVTSDFVEIVTKWALALGGVAVGMVIASQLLLYRPLLHCSVMAGFISPSILGRISLSLTLHLVLSPSLKKHSFIFLHM